MDWISFHKKLLLMHLMNFYQIDHGCIGFLKKNLMDSNILMDYFYSIHYNPNSNLFYPLFSLQLFISSLRKLKIVKSYNNLLSTQSIFLFYEDKPPIFTDGNAGKTLLVESE